MDSTGIRFSTVNNRIELSMDSRSNITSSRISRSTNNHQHRPQQHRHHHHGSNNSSNNRNPGLSLPLTPL